MARRSHPYRNPAGLPADLYAYAHAGLGRAPRRLQRTEKWRPVVIDDWPERIPITDAELDIVEAHFADLLDDLFGPRR